MKPDQDSLIMRCPSCGTKNRIPAARRGERPVCGRCRTPLSEGTFPDRPVEISDGTFQQEVLSFDGPVLVDCWAPWCGPCRAVAPVLDQLASEYAGRIKIAKLNTDENPLTASRYSIQSIPTMLLFNRGKQVDRMVGALPRREIESRLRALL